jgi:murein tripeptide amidase MpaA
VKKRALFTAEFLSNPDNPTIVFLTQQHGNEQLTTEGALEFIKHLGNNKTKDVLDGVNVIVIPMLNPDGAMGDVNFDISHYIADDGRHLTRRNANNVDLNREHAKPIEDMEPEARALHEYLIDLRDNKGFEVDYLIDLHHQGARSGLDGELVSGSILYPLTTNGHMAGEAGEEIRDRSKRLGSVVYHAISEKGWGLIAKYRGGTGDNIGRNGFASRYGILTLLFEMRGMSDHEYDSYVLGQKSNGYLIQQTIITLDSTVRAIADGSIDTADISFWDTLPFQQWLGGVEEADDGNE